MTFRLPNLARAFALAMALAVGLTAMPAQAQFRLNLLPRIQDALQDRFDFAQSQGQCLSNPEIQQAVVSGRILPLAVILQAAGVVGNSQVLSARVCETQQGTVYYVAVLDAYGQARNLVLNAVTGQTYSNQ
jgi:hypothetical protein